MNNGLPAQKKKKKKLTVSKLFPNSEDKRDF